MFWSKIWFFLVATAAILGIGIALTVPRPAERKVLESEDVRLERAMDAARLWLVVEARTRADTALRYARYEIYKELKRIKEDAASAKAIAQQLHDSARATLEAMLAGTRSGKPQVLIALDAWGRVVARVSPDPKEDKEWGDDLSGYFLVRDALRGYMRDDLWWSSGKLYRVAAAPVIARPEQGVDSYVGVLIAGYEVDEAFARQVAGVASTRSCGDGSTDVCDTHVAFFAHGETVANSGPVTLGSEIKQELVKRAATISDDRYTPFSVSGEATSYRAVARKLPGEAGMQDGFYVVYAERPHASGLGATLKSIVKDDLDFANFPWILLGAGFAAVVLIGLLLMWVEGERPLKRLVRDALAVGKGEKRTFSEDEHHGKHGSIVRSINMALDKLSREKGARKDLGALYSASEEAETVRPLPPINLHGSPVTSFAPPPASEMSLDSSPAPSAFEYSIQSAPPPISSAASAPMRAASARPVPAPPRPGPVVSAPETPPPVVPPRPVSLPPAMAPARVAPAARPLSIPPVSPLSSLDDDILGHAHDPDEAHLVTPPPRSPSASLNVTSMPEALLTDSSAMVRQQSTPEGEEAYFRQVFEDFIELKRKCGENTDSLTYEKFAGKLAQNRDQLIAKYACKAVKFQVYVKDGKAALKATPVKA